VGIILVWLANIAAKLGFDMVVNRGGESKPQSRTGSLLPAIAVASVVVAVFSGVGYIGLKMYAAGVAERAATAATNAVVVAAKSAENKAVTTAAAEGKKNSADVSDDVAIANETLSKMKEELDALRTKTANAAGDDAIVFAADDDWLRQKRARAIAAVGAGRR
jgi:hypothetical protein